MRSYKVKIIIGSTENTEWWTDQDWENHRKFVEKSKADGTYGTEVECEITIVNNPLFDDLSLSTHHIESTRFEIIDLSKYKG